MKDLKLEMPSIVRKKIDVKKPKSISPKTQTFCLYILLGCMEFKISMKKNSKMVPCLLTNLFNAWGSLESEILGAQSFHYTSRRVD